MLDALNFLLHSRKFWTLVFALLSAQRDLSLQDITREEAESRAIVAVQNFFASDD